MVDFVALTGIMSSGEPFQIMSGIVEVGPKVQSFAHLIFNVHTGKCCVNAQAVALRMDLAARKAITLDEEALANCTRKESRQIDNFSDGK